MLKSGLKGTPALKDETLNAVADRANVAQFVSFGPDLRQRYSRLHGLAPNYQFPSPLTAVSRLIQSSVEHRVNIRTFGDLNSRSSDFIMSLSSAHVVLDYLQGFSERGLYSIVNESIDVNDGGVSGVAYGGIVEFAPGVTPRCVEGGDVAALPTEIAIGVFERVYGFTPKLDDRNDTRTEFSLHPNRRGVQRDHTIFWEIDHIDSHRLPQRIRWPNDFSRYLGDKLFGLVLADVLGFSVPRTLAITRRLPPFSFGKPTRSESGLLWVRTCPATKTPGKFTTVRGWTDPFALMQNDDPAGDLVSSVLVQDEVDPIYSGALLSTQTGPPVIEGVKGTGGQLMLGGEGPGDLPERIKKDVQDLYEKVDAKIGRVRMEWVHDGRAVWVVQVQQEWTEGYEDTIFPSEDEAVRYREFNLEDILPDDRLPKLRELVAQLPKTGVGVILKGHVGLTSHLADVLRDAKVPSKRVRPGGDSPQLQIEFRS